MEEGVSKVSAPEPLEPENDVSIVSLPQAAKILKKKGINLSQGRLRRLAKMGKIAVLRMGNRYYLQMAKLLDDIADTSSPLWTK